MEILLDTYKDSKIGRIPKDWGLIKLSELGEFYRGHTYSAKNVQSTGLLVLRSTNIQNRTLVLHKDLVFVDKNCKEDILLRNGDIVICMANGSKRLVGKSAKYFGEDRKDITIGAFCSIYRSKNALVNYLFETYYYKKYLQITLAGSTINNLKNSELEKFTFPFPNDAKEQQKIVAILSTVDEQISNTDKIIEKSKDLKKGLMQKLFSEGIGHTEFKDTKNGRIPKDWDLEKLNTNVLKVGSGVTPKGGSSVYLNEGIPLIRSQNVLYGKLQLNGVACIDEPQHKKMKNSQLQENDVLLNISGASIGRSGVVSKNILPANVNQHVCIIRTTERINASYLSYYLISNGGQNQIFRLQAGGNREGLNFQHIRSFKIPLPPVSEQQKIAAILSEADAKIEKEQTQKVQLEQLKKGLMQQLLTGKKRVKV